MKAYIYCLVAALLGTTLAWGQERGPPRGPSAAEEGVEVLTRGPVHEAFAETVAFDPEPGVVVEKPAPEAIEELPPDQKPEGANVDWISGYWAWDDERDDFLWVSGIWRSLPPGRQWVSGYWASSGRGSQWTSGYWADAKTSEIEYLPEPPQSVEEGPNMEAPSADHAWLPGCWVWHESRYSWRPGYWTTVQPNWVWIPAHYCWTPRGYVFVDGYYDHSVARRGVLYAPVYFSSRTYSRRGFSYSPATVIHPAVFATHLFLRPSYGHYYFGDYYGPSYASSGYSPWFSYHSSRRGYDPFYAHQRWHHRNDRQWDRRVQSDFAHRRDHEEARPPRTWTAQRERTAAANSDDQTFLVAASIDELAKNKEHPVRFQPLAKEDRQQLGERGKEVRLARQERQKLEAEGTRASVDAPARNTKPVKVKLPKTPIVAATVQQSDADNAPPPAAKPPQPDSQIEPKPRKARGNAVSPREPKVTTREPKPDRPSSEPKVDAKPDRPRVEPKPDRSSVGPKPPKVDAKPDRPRVEPKPDRPSVEPKPPKVDSKPDRPRVEPKPERPNVKPTDKPNRGSDDRPQGGSKGPPKAKGNNKPGN